MQFTQAERPRKALRADRTGVERPGAQRHSGRFSTCNDTLGKLHSLKGPGNLMGTKLDISKLGGTLDPPPSLPQAARHPLHCGHTELGFHSSVFRDLATGQCHSHHAGVEKVASEAQKDVVAHALSPRIWEAESGGSP